MTATFLVLITLQEMAWSPRPAPLPVNDGFCLGVLPVLAEAGPAHGVCSPDRALLPLPSGVALRSDPAV
ncbi:hypothetical protein [Streptomyces sp. NPDC058964]|uniref:hypothetical protein n=1 Tax=Streptomyces sp. NPDC058964 TaxID=3346681 RepID=UPI0036B8599E